MTETAQAAPAAEHSTKVDTAYVVLVKVTNGPQATASVAGDFAWRVVGEVSAKTPEAAVKKYAEAHRPKEGEKLTLVAVAAARWTPVTVEERVKRELVIGS